MASKLAQKTSTRHICVHLICKETTTNEDWRVVFYMMSTFSFFQFLLLAGFILFCGKGKCSVDGKFKSPQGELLPVHKGARTANVCKGEPDGHYIDAHNPYGYITCLGGQTYRRNCAPGLMWDNNKKSCVRQFK
ncbi:uncharacterized protein LOC144631419 [Oculina patagonica]